MDENQNNPTLSECIDACRPGHDDLALAEMAELARQVNVDNSMVQTTFERSQRLDVAIGQAFQDVEAPLGLSERCLLALETQDGPYQSALNTDCSTETPVAQTEQAPVSTSERKWFRRAILGGSVAATLAVGLFAFGVFSGDKTYSRSDLQEFALSWVDDLPYNSWDTDIATALSTHPLPPSFAKSVVARKWLLFQTQQFGKAVVYDLTPPGEKFVFVFVIPTRGEFQNVGSSFVSQQPDFTTRNRNLAFAWDKSKGLLYVLVLEGQDVNRYRSLFNQRPFT